MYPNAWAPGESSSIERFSSRKTCPSVMSQYMYPASSEPSCSGDSHRRSVSPLTGDKHSISCSFSRGSTHKKFIFPNKRSSLALWFIGVCFHSASIPLHLSIFVVRFSHVTPSRSCFSHFETQPNISAWKYAPDSRKVHAGACPVGLFLLPLTGCLWSHGLPVCTQLHCWRAKTYSRFAKTWSLTISGSSINNSVISWWKYQECGTFTASFRGGCALPGSLSFHDWRVIVLSTLVRILLSMNEWIPCGSCRCPMSNRFLAKFTKENRSTDLIIIICWVRLWHWRETLVWMGACTLQGRLMGLFQSLVTLL